MAKNISSKHLNKKVMDSIAKAKDLEERIKREEKLLEEEIYEMAKYVKVKLSLGLDIFRIQLPDSAFELKKIILTILNKSQRKQSDNIVLRQYLVSYPEFIDTLKLRDNLSDPKELLLKISQHLKKEEIYQDHVIFYNGQLGKTFYLILEGEVSILLPYEFKIKITDKQLFKYMSFLLEHREYDLIRLILNSNSIILNDNDYGENELFIQFKSVIDKALPLHVETEKISSKDYIKRFNFFDEIENKSIFEKIKKIKKEEKKKVNKEKGKDINDNIFNRNEKNNKRNNNSYEKEKKGKKNEDNKKENKKDNNKDKNDKYKSKDVLEEMDKESEESEENEESEEIKENKENGEKKKKKKKNFFYNMEVVFTVWKYFEVVRLSKGKCFGELALQKEGKKRNATIITTQNSVFGILQKDVYQMFIKETMDKARKTNVEILLKSKLFRGCNSEKFENLYFTCFKFMKKYKGDYLFKQGEQRKFIYFIKKGEVQIELFNNCFNIDNILENLGYPDENSEIKDLIKNEKKIELFCNINRKFNVLIFSGDAIGLADHIVSEKNEELIFSGLCVTYCELFALDKKFFDKMMEDKNISNNYIKMIKERKERLCERLLQLRSNIILQHYNLIKENLENKKILEKKLLDNEGNTINKKKEFKKFISQDNKEELGYNSLNINFNDEIINKGSVLKKRFDDNFSRTMMHINPNNRGSQNMNIQNSEKFHKHSNYLNTENFFNKSKKRLSNQNKSHKRSSIKVLDYQEPFLRKNIFQLKQENNKLNDNNIKINIGHMQNEKLIKEISKFSKSFIKSENPTNPITPRYSEKEFKHSSKKPKEIRKYPEKNIFIKKQNNSNNIFTNFGNYKLHKLLLKKSFIYSEIDKIDKIIINNFDKISPLSCKMLINKKKEKRKVFQEINTEPNLVSEGLFIEKNKFSNLKKKDKEKQYILITKKDDKIKKRNNFALPLVSSKSKNNDKNMDNQNIYSKEVNNIFINNKIKSLSKQ